MFFFINSTLHANNSGIEHAQWQRASVFKNHNLPFKLLYMTFNPQLSHWATIAHISDDQYLNLFDYYQRADDNQPEIVTVDDLFKHDQTIHLQVNEQQPAELLATANQELVAKVQFMERIFTGGQVIKQVVRVDYFNSDKHVFRVDHYDYRGFLSMSEYFDETETLTTKNWYDLAGRIVVTQTFTKNSMDKLLSRMWEVVDLDGIRHVYFNFSQVVTGFLNDLNQQYWSTSTPNYFVIDRADGFDDCLLALDKPAIKILHLHNNHSADVHDEYGSFLNEYYEYALFNNDRYNYFITATEKQAHDMRRRFGLTTEVRAIPVGVAQPVKQLSLADRTPHSILVTARRAPEKQLDKIIEAVFQARKVVPDITLDIFGYSDSWHNFATDAQIQAVIKKRGLQHAVTVNDYQPNLDYARDHHQMYIVFSTMEGFNLGLMEALNHGEVGIANRVNYGPAELVQDGKNGYVVGFNDEQALADAIVDVFSDETLAQTLSDGAYALSKRYEDAVIYDRWQKIITDSQLMWQALPSRAVATKGL